jgi:opacity protein-like surface antigen
VEVEARDVHLNLAGLKTNVRQVTVGGGALYTWRHFHNFSPYAKFEMGLGRDDFPNEDPPGTKPFKHDVLTYMAPGAGLEYRVYRHIWVRADYEFQRWGPLPPYNHNPTPNGFTIGAMYDFRHHH